ncbi:MAG TPA: hypothetical protein VMI94_01475 [Bryobacteraceae bacterium]|nr:hypothetical protein [Bryobacteraceae bacterium]
MTCRCLPILPAICWLAWAAQSPPSSAEQAKLVEEIRAGSLAYTRQLPDFICVEQTRRYVDETGQEAWRLVDTLTAQLSYFDQRENHKLISQNGRTAKDTSYESAGGALSMGDFGSTLRDIFDSASRTVFTWQKDVALRGRRSHVLSFRIARPVYAIEYDGDPTAGPQRAKVSSRGSIFVDPQRHSILRITQEATGIPPSFPIQEAKQTLDYDFVRIGDADFFVPMAATTRVRIQTYSGAVCTKTEKRFQQYRKYAADAVIKFDELPPE